MHMYIRLLFIRQTGFVKFACVIVNPSERIHWKNPEYYLSSVFPPPWSLLLGFFPLQFYVFPGFFTFDNLKCLWHFSWCNVKCHFIICKWSFLGFEPDVNLLGITVKSCPSLYLQFILSSCKCLTEQLCAVLFSKMSISYSISVSLSRVHNLNLEWFTLPGSSSMLSYERKNSNRLRDQLFNPSFLCREYSTGSTSGMEQTRLLLYFITYAIEKFQKEIAFTLGSFSHLQHQKSIFKILQAAGFSGI